MKKAENESLCVFYSLKITTSKSLIYIFPDFFSVDVMYIDLCMTGGDLYMFVGILWILFLLFSFNCLNISVCQWILTFCIISDGYSVFYCMGVL